MITEKQISEISERIANNIKPDKIVLFGSYAYGIPNDDSDLDLCIIEKNVDSKIVEKRRIRETIGKIDFAVDILVPDLQEFEFYKNEINSVYHDIDKKGIVLWKRPI